jgi:hypothetical protein
MEIINPWHLYLWTRLDSLQDLFEVFAFFIGPLLLAWIPLFSDRDTRAWSKQWGRFFLPVHFIFFIFLILGAVLIPSKKDMAIIYIIPKIANNEVIQKEANEIYQIAKEALIEVLPNKKKAEE